VRQPDSPTGAHVWLVNSCRCAAAVTLAAAILLLLRVRGRSALIIVTAAAATAAELQLRAPLYRCKASSTAHQGDGGRQASHTNAIAPAPSELMAPIFAVRCAGLHHRLSHRTARRRRRRRRVRARIRSSVPL
jgi:hypothetical protein